MTMRDGFFLCLLAMALAALVAPLLGPPIDWLIAYWRLG